MAKETKTANKDSLARTIAEEHQLTLRESREIVDTVIYWLQDNLTSHQSVRLHGLGTLKPVYRNPRTARNPQTGESIAVPGRYVVKFKPQTSFRGMLAYTGDL